MNSCITISSSQISVIIHLYKVSHMLNSLPDMGYKVITYNAESHMHYYNISMQIWKNTKESFCSSIIFKQINISLTCSSQNITGKALIFLVS